MRASLIGRCKNRSAICMVRSKFIHSSSLVIFSLRNFKRVCLYIYFCSSRWIGKKWRAPWEADLLRIVNELLFCGAHTSCRRWSCTRASERANRICTGCTYTQENEEVRRHCRSQVDETLEVHGANFKAARRTTFPISWLPTTPEHARMFIFDAWFRIQIDSFAFFDCVRPSWAQQHAPNWFSAVTTGKLINSAGASSAASF